MGVAEPWIMFSQNGCGDQSNMRRSISKIIKHPEKLDWGCKGILSSIITKDRIKPCLTRRQQRSILVTKEGYNYHD